MIARRAVQNHRAPQGADVASTFELDLSQGILQPRFESKFAGAGR